MTSSIQFPPSPPAPPESPNDNEWNRAADFWFHDRGVNVIPCDTKKKTTYTKWSQWQIRPIPPELFEEWKRQNAFKDGIGIIVGRVWRGKYKERNFIFIDCDNKKAIDEICTVSGKTKNLQDLAKTFIIEQHRDNPNKAHIYFYSDIPFEKKSSDVVATTATLDQKTSPENIPAFEVKGKATHGIAYCWPSYHKDGHRYEIIGTNEPVVMNPGEAHGFMDHLDAICRKHKLKYLKDSSSSVSAYGEYGESDSQGADELFQVDVKIYEGHNRHLAVLRACDSLLRKFHRDFSEDEIREMAWNWNEKHCEPPLDDKEFEKQWQQSKKWIARKVQEQEEQDEEWEEMQEASLRGDSGQEQQSPRRPEKQEQTPPPPSPKVELTEDLTRELTYEEVAEILSTSIKKDHAAKIISFSAMLLSQTNGDQMNIGYQAESSSGKSWIPLELSVYFPENEVQLIASASPTAFFHDGGNWDKDRKILLVDLEHKILIFIDQPHFQLQEKLRPLLSHDRKELIYKITDKSQKHGLRTKNVILRGYPSTFFCTTNLDPDEQEKTRMLLLSPEVDQNKLYESLELTALRKGNYEEYSKRIMQDPKRAWLKNRIYLIRQWGIREIILPADGRTVFERFIKEHPYLQPRHQRDFPRIFNLIKGHALLNCFNRERIKPDTIIATYADIEAGFKLYKYIERSNELGLSPYIHTIYEDVILPLLRKLTRDSEGEAIEGLSKEKIIKRHYEVRHKPLSPEMLKSILLQLESVGLVKQEPDPNDRRKTLVYPTVSSDIS
jgi:Bifunctional DNA primase/polymerase, N-terminal